MRFEAWLRQRLITQDEFGAISSWRAFIAPEEHLYTSGGERWDPAEPERCDLGWGLLPRLGWIQGISRSGAALVINHFAIEKSLTGLGLGKRLAHGFGQAVKAHAGIDEIMFTEYAPSAAHHPFFTKQLGAVRQPYIAHHDRDKWVWKIP